jgi:hypothetical protein
MTPKRMANSDWETGDQPAGTFGQEQTFNFLELQPYHE